jgi:FMN-dependent NADH-azoreductase
MKLLHVDSSVLGQHSASRELSAAVVARWQAALPAHEVS